MSAQLLMGNQAIAYGALAGGVQFVSGYPGTPSSEIIAALAPLSKKHNFYVEWSVNEKVALEVAAGAALGGARALCTMKHVGLNVAADPLMTLAYLGVEGGLVILVADDPGIHSSQNEQDTRLFGRFAKLPVLDPEDPIEALKMMQEAFQMSEKLKLPVIVRPTMRVSHAYQNINWQLEYHPPQIRGFNKERNWVALPATARQRHPQLNAAQEQARELLGDSGFNQVIQSKAENRAGIIACGVAFGYVREALERSNLQSTVDLVKISAPYPLPDQPVLQMLQQKEKVLVLEELEPVVEDQVIKLAWTHSLTTNIQGKNNHLVPREGELNVDIVTALLEEFLQTNSGSNTVKKAKTAPSLPLRPPVMCSGCPHRASYYVFKKASQGLNPIFAGDIGCYTLGTMHPLEAMDTCLCMGASIGMASGFSRAEPERVHIAILGDSTFFHTGVPGLLNAVYNQANITVAILDNHTTAMTGHQPHPGTGQMATGEVAAKIDIAALAKACGVQDVRVLDPLLVKKSVKETREALQSPGPSVLVIQSPCVVNEREPNSGKKFIIEKSRCNNCRNCIEVIACPAIEIKKDKPYISDKCAGCALCVYICPQAAIRRVTK